jgi:hypothetical protein
MLAFFFTYDCKQPLRTKKAIKQKLDDFGYWVDDRVRTGDIWNHNPVL